MKEIELKIDFQGKTPIKAIEVQDEIGVKLLAEKYYCKQPILKNYYINLERSENLHDKYIIIDCQLVNIDPQINYSHLYFAIKKKISKSPVNTGDLLI